MYAEDTIAAVATPPGRGGIGIVRVSGPQARSIAARIFKARQPLSASHRFHVGTVIDAEETPIDEALAVLMRAPASYTGEDVLELHCHGSPVILRRVLARCCEAGARPAEPGEFTKRAFVNGRIDLVQAEAVAEIVDAGTEAAARAGLRHLSGALSAQLAQLRDALLEIRAQAEVLIDFPDEDVDLTPAALTEGLAAVGRQLESLLASYRRGRLLREGLHVAIVGRPNVGKSSLLNALAGSDRAIVTPIPGTTRDVIEEGLDVDGIPVVLLDTAGMRENADGVERIGIDRARRRAAEADVVLVVVDRSCALTSEDHHVIRACEGQAGLLVVNKCDLPAAWQPAALHAISTRPTVEICALTGDGLPVLRAAVSDLVGAAPHDAGASVVTLARHRDALDKARVAVESAHVALQAGRPIDVVSVDIQAAAEYIGEITGAVTTDEVLDRIFSAFCIGK